MKRVKCDSGVEGWQCRLQKNYKNYLEFKMYDEAFGVAARLGYSSAIEAWDENPVVQGSVIPSDFRKVSR